jgi:hypothetical protein
MTDYKLSKLYEVVRSANQLANDPLAMPKVRGRAHRQACQGVDVIAMGIDDRQAQMLDWAAANGYPEWATVLRFAGRATCT